MDNLELLELNAIESFKRENLAGYNLYKNENRPKTPDLRDPDFKQKLNQWKRDIIELCFSEETEISPQDAKLMIKELEERFPHCQYKQSPVPENHPTLKHIKTPQPTEWLRGKFYIPYFL